MGVRGQVSSSLFQRPLQCPVADSRNEVQVNGRTKGITITPDVWSLKLPQVSFTCPTETLRASGQGKGEKCFSDQEIQPLKVLVKSGDVLKARPLDGLFLDRPVLPSQSQQIPRVLWKGHAPFSAPGSLPQLPRVGMAQRTTSISGRGPGRDLQLCQVPRSRTCFPCGLFLQPSKQESSTL